MLKIGITGGIGSGKSTACKVFEILGIPVFYADKVATDLMRTDAELKHNLKQTFGNQAYFDDGQLNRKYLAEIVFEDVNQLEKLNGLVHPAVFRAFDLWLPEQEKYPYILKEAALLVESGSYKMCDYTILVKAPLDLKIKRTMLRDNMKENVVQLRMDKQLSDVQKQAFADFILLNNEQELLIPQVLALHQHFLALQPISS